MHFNITSYWGWVGRVEGEEGEGGSSGICLRILEKREKEEYVVSYQNKSRFFFLSVISQLLESIYTVLIFHHKRRGCAKKFTNLVQSEKAVTVIAVMSSATSHLPSGSQSGNLA